MVSAKWERPSLYPLVSKEIIMLVGVEKRTRLIIKHLGTFVNIKSRMQEGIPSGN
ncbi:MAG: hypothetical protein AABZ15_14565 [Nitrospirota bacterium]